MIKIEGNLIKVKEDIHNFIYEIRTGIEGLKGGASKDQFDLCLESTADRLAHEHGVSSPTVKRAGKFATELENQVIKMLNYPYVRITYPLAIMSK